MFGYVFALRPVPEAVAVSAREPAMAIQDRAASASSLNEFQNCIHSGCAYSVPERTDQLAGFVVSSLFSGAPRGTRTPNLLVRSLTALHTEG